MEPTLGPGAALWVEFEPDRLRFGDLVLFRQADYLVAHRYLGRWRERDGRPSLRTRGDARPVLDPAVEPSGVLGRAVGALRPDGWRSLEGARARAYARCLALHALAWTWAGGAARRLEEALARAGARVPLREAAARTDARLLRAADRLLFDRLHPAMPAPPGATPPAARAVG